MGKLREWMHGKGRPVVIAVMIILALWIIVDYYRSNHDEPDKEKAPAVISEQKEPAATEPAVTDPDIVTTKEDAGIAGKSSGPENGDITIGFTGDINFDETWSVMKHMRRKGKGIAGCIDPRLIKKMRGYDYMVVNNEFSISDRGKPMAGKAYTFRSPRRNVKLLKQLGVDAVSLANNHVYDYGKQAFLDTMSTLEKNGIKYTGGGKNSSEARKPVYFQCKGKTIAVIAATRAEKYVLTPAAGKNSPGVFRTYDDTQYCRAIKKAKKKADVVIAFVHWGTEYSTKLEDAQKTQAKDYINAGADVIVGAHTHCLQGVGSYKGKPIFYSLGNYWFNEKTLYTTLLQLTIKENGKIRARMIPCRQSGKETHMLTKKKKVRKFVNYVNGISVNARIGAKGILHVR
ncbi:MAG: CapA family protein [Lachnospiraceae bacterium]|nr:CapA family protein [Lachnospiraceae bacterium]